MGVTILPVAQCGSVSTWWTLRQSSRNQKHLDIKKHSKVTDVNRLQYQTPEQAQPRMPQDKTRQKQSAKLQHKRTPQSRTCQKLDRANHRQRTTNSELNLRYHVAKTNSTDRTTGSYTTASEERLHKKNKENASLTVEDQTSGSHERAHLPEHFTHRRSCKRPRGTQPPPIHEILVDLRQTTFFRNLQTIKWIFRNT